MTKALTHTLRRTFHLEALWFYNYYALVFELHFTTTKEEENKKHNEMRITRSAHFANQHVHAEKSIHFFVLLSKTLSGEMLQEGKKWFPKNGSQVECVMGHHKTNKNMETQHRNQIEDINGCASCILNTHGNEKPLECDIECFRWFYFFLGNTGNLKTHYHGNVSMCEAFCLFRHHFMSV